MEYRKRLALERLHDDYYPFYRQAPSQEDIPKRHGKTIRFRRWANLSVPSSTLTEGITPTSTALSAVSFTAGLAQYGAYTVITDLLQDTALGDTEREAMEILGDQMWETAENYVISRLGYPSNMTSSTKGLWATRGFPIYGGTTGAARWDATNVHVSAAALSTFSLKSMRFLVKELKRLKVKPINGAFKAIVNTTVAAHLRNNPELHEFLKYNPEGTQWMKKGYVESGYLGRIEGIDFFETTYAPTMSCRTATKAAGSTAFPCLIFGKGAYARTKITGSNHVMRMIVKRPSKFNTDDPLDQRSTVGWKWWQGAAILNNSCGLWFIYKRADTDIIGW